MKKQISEQPSPWRKSCEREYCYGDRVYDVMIVSDYRCMYVGYTIILYGIGT